MKSSLYLLLCLLSVFTLTFSSCEDDDAPLTPQGEATNDLLKGNWKVESFIINDEEQIGGVVTSFTITFDKRTPTGGIAAWQIFLDTNSDQLLEGDYTITRDGMQLNFSDNSFDMTVSENELRLRGTTPFDGELVTGSIVAERD